MRDAGYMGPFFQKEIKGLKIWTMSWVPNLNWEPGQKVPTVDLKEHPPIICIGIGIKYKCFKKEEIASIVSRLRESNVDVTFDDITIPREALSEIADELGARSKLSF